MVLGLVRQVGLAKMLPRKQLDEVLILAEQLSSHLSSRRREVSIIENAIGDRFPAWVDPLVLQVLRGIKDQNEMPVLSSSLLSVENEPTVPMKGQGQPIEVGLGVFEAGSIVEVRDETTRGQFPKK
jgi:hypothetical protein